MSTPLNPQTDGIVEMWKTGLSSGQIARNLSITRNAVMGIIARARVAGKIDYRVSAERIAAIKARNAVWEQEKDKLINPPKGNVNSKAITLTQLTPYSCRYIVGRNKNDDALFCGEPRSISSYCKDHHALCYTPKIYAIKKKETNNDTAAKPAHSAVNA